MIGVPDFGEPSWLDKTRPVELGKQLVGSISCDWLIVGAGLTGLAAAQHLANLRTSDRIVVVDAAQLGTGSSSRSSGFIVSLGQFDLAPRHNAALHRLGCAGIASLKKTLLDRKIDCDWNESGRLIAARGTAGAKTLQKIRKTLEQIESPWSSVSADDVERITGMRGYVDCIRQHESILVNPAKLHRAMLDSLPDTVEVYERSQVDSITKRKGWDVKLSDGQIQTSNLLITNNAFATSLGIGRNQVLPMRTYIGAFRPVPGSAAMESTETDWGLTSVERVGSSLRRVGERIFVRNSARCGFNPKTGFQSELDQVSQTQQKSLSARFPDTKFELENLWSGLISVTANAAQLFGKLDDGLFASTGYNGHGIAQGVISGQLLVDLALNRPSERLDDICNLPRPWWIPSGAIRDRAVQGFLNYLSWRHAIEV